MPHFQTNNVSTRPYAIRKIGLNLSSFLPSKAALTLACGNYAEVRQHIVKYEHMEALSHILGYNSASLLARQIEISRFAAYKITVQEWFCRILKSH